MGIRSNKVLWNATAAGTGSWFNLDSRFEDFAQRAIHGTVTSGDTIAIQGITKDIRITDTGSLATLDSADIATIGSYTADFADILNGNWTWIRVVKTGSTGPSKVQGNI